MSVIRVLIVERLPEIRALLTTTLSLHDDVQIVGQAGTAADGYELLQSTEIDVVLISDDLPDMEGPKAIWLYTTRERDLAIIVLTAAFDIEHLRRCMMAGARSYVAKPVDNRELVEAIRDVAERMRRKRAERRRQVVPATGPLVVRPATATGKVIAVFGAKGGVGKTTLAVNLAIGLRLKTKHSVALLDSDLSFGACGLLLDIEPTHSIVDFAEAYDQMGEEVLEAQFVKGLMPRHNATGLRIMLSPPRPEHAELIKAEHLKQLMDVVPLLFDWVVIDCPQSYDERLLAILEAIGLALLIIVPEVGALKNARHFLSLLDALGYSKEQVRIVLNRYNSHVGITLEDIDQWLAHPIAYGIPSGGSQVTASANRGLPLLLAEPKNPVSKAMARIIDALAGESP